MKRKIFKLSALLLGLCASVGFFGNKDIETAKAADPVWGVVGSFKASNNWSKDIPYTYCKTDSQYEAVIEFAAGDEFKIRTDGKWEGGIVLGYDAKFTGGGIDTYLTAGSDGNFKVKDAGTYLLTLPSNINEYGDKLYGVSIAKQLEEGKEIWGLIGSFSESGWNNDFDLTYNKEEARYEIMYTFKAKDEFKIRYNNAWDISLGMESADANAKKYLSGSGNCIVNAEGTYLISIKDKAGSHSIPKAKTLSIEPATVGKHTVTYYNGTTVLKTVEVADDGNAFNPENISQEGYRLEGWYTDAALTQPYTPSAVTADLSLYGKYVKAESYGIYVKNTQKWTKMNAYLWIGGNNNSWPGVEMKKVEGTDYYYIEIAATQDYDHAIFNDGNGKQTVDLELAGKTVYYEIGKLESGKYTAPTTEAMREVIAFVPGDVFVSGATATGTGFATISFDNGAIAVKENDASITASEKQAALIERIAKVDTCTEYSKHAIYRELVTVSGIEGALSLTITDKGGEVTIGDKLAFMEHLDVVNSKPAAPASTHTVLAGQSSSLWFVIMIGVLGLGSVLGYYFLSKKRFSK